MFPIIPSFPEPISLHNCIQIRIQRARRRVAALLYSKHQPIHRNPQLGAQPRHSLQRGHLLRPFDMADEGPCHAYELRKLILSHTQCLTALSNTPAYGRIFNIFALTQFNKVSLYLEFLNLLYLDIPNIARVYHPIILLLGDDILNTRKQALGDRNIIGARVTEARKRQGMKQIELLAKIQLLGVDMSVPALSLLEGQKRSASDIELCAIADVLNVSVDWLLGRE